MELYKKSRFGEQQIDQSHLSHCWRIVGGKNGFIDRNYGSLAIEIKANKIEHYLFTFLTSFYVKVKQK